MMKPRIPFGPEPKPLSSGELARVLGWQRRMYRFYGVAMILITTGFYLMVKFGDTGWVRPLLLVMLFGLMAGGAYVQFRERCPRCHTLLGRQSRFVLGPKCKSCGVGFPRETDSHAPRA